MGSYCNKPSLEDDKRDELYTSQSKDRILIDSKPQWVIKDGELYSV